MLARSPLASLVVVAVSAAVIWRLEVEWHGWEGLRWVAYAHVAVPVGCGLFLGWVGLVARPRRPRVTLVAALAVFGLVAHRAVYLALSWHFAAGPSAMFQPPGLASLLAPVVALTAVPVGTAAIARWAGVQVGWWRLLVALGVFHAAWPVAVFLLAAVEHRGGADALHAIKSGFVIPGLVLGLGLLFVPSQASAPSPRVPAGPGTP